MCAIERSDAQRVDAIRKLYLRSFTGQEPTQADADHCREIVARLSSRATRQPASRPRGKRQRAAATR